MSRLLVLLLVLLIFTPKNGNAGIDFYSSCVKNYDYGNSKTDIVEVTPLNWSCQKKCKRSCEIFSQRNRDGIELNDDVILNCRAKCQGGEVTSGQVFSSYYRKEVVRDGIRKIVYVGPQSISEFCELSEERDINYVQSSIAGLRNGDKLKIRLADGDQTVYMCGHKFRKIIPLLSSTDENTWNSNGVQNIYKQKDEHICLLSIDDARFNSLTFKDLWKEFDKPQYASEVFDECRWHARNHRYINTLVYPQEGDEFSISWKGNYSYFKYAYRIAQGPTHMTRDDILFCLDPENSASVDPSKKDGCKSLLYVNSGLHFYNTSILAEADKATDQGVSVFGESLRIPEIDIPTLKAANCNLESRTENELLFHGLIGRITDDDYKLTLSSIDPRCANETNYACDNIDRCYSVDSLGKANYSFSGNIDTANHTISSGSGLGFPPHRAPLYLRHYDDRDSNPTAARGKYADNIGGYEVDIEWGGCPIHDGQNLQYAVWSGDALVPDTEWQDVPENIFFGSDPLEVVTSYQGEEGGVLYFRIKQEITSVSPGSYFDDLYNNPGNRFGEYTIGVRQHGKYGALDPDNVFRKLVIMVKETILGYEKSGGEYVDGVTQIIYKQVIKDVQLIQTIQALLVLYVILQAIMFSMGVVNINQKEFIIRIFKIALIIAIIAPNSWEFLYYNFLRAFIEGSIELIALVVSAAYPDIPGIEVKEDPTLVFAVFGAVNKMVFNNSVWIKIQALVVHGLVGFMIAFMILLAMLIYWLCVVRAIVMYIFSLIGISLLILLAPIFIPLVLFKITEQFFSSWWKLILSFALQPVMVFTTITIFNVLIIALLYSSLNFTACKGCLWHVSIGAIGYSHCWIPAYKIAMGLHTPGEFSGTFLPLNVLGAGIAFLLLAHAMWEFTSFITQITSRLVTQMFIRSATVSGQEEQLSAGVAETGKMTIDTSVLAAQKIAALKKKSKTPTPPGGGG